MKENKDFIEKDIIDFASTILSQKSRKRKYVDPRNFLINILIYKFKWTEEQVSILFRMDRTSVNYAKDMAYHLQNDLNYMEHTIEVREKFSDYVPSFNDKNKDKQEEYVRKRPVTMQLNKAEFEKLAHYKNTLRMETMGGAARVFIFSNINKII